MTLSTIKKKYRAILRVGINRKNRKLLANKDVSIISSNCTGGVIAHELGIGFASPTVNMFIQPADYIKFCKNIRYYLSIEPIQIKENGLPYPVALIEDIKVFCVHYKSFDEFKEKWNARRLRCNYDNMAFIMSERDGCTYDDILQFDKLDLKKKVVFVSKDMPEIKSSIHIPGSENTGDLLQPLKILTGYKNIFSGYRLIDKFDYVAFLNDGIIKLK